jgi:hypothetical protein
MTSAYMPRGHLDRTVQKRSCGLGAIAEVDSLFLFHKQVLYSLSGVHLGSCHYRQTRALTWTLNKRERDAYWKRRRQPGSKWTASRFC